MDFESETSDEIASVKVRIGQEVVLSSCYTQSARALMVSVEGETATIRFPRSSNTERGSDSRSCRR
jgi:hypothetical protein